MCLSLFITATVIYLLAGATVLMLLYEIEVIGQAMNRLVPKERKVKTYLRGKPLIMTIVFWAWPLALLALMFINYRDNWRVYA